MKKLSTRLCLCNPFSQCESIRRFNLSRRFALFIILVFMATAGFAQAPNISYTGPNVYATGAAITPLTPTNTGGKVPNPATVKAVPASQMPQFSSVQGFAVDAAGNIYFPNLAGNNVLKFPVGGGAAIPLGSGINYPAYVALDAAGNVYVSDFWVGEIWKIPVGGGPQTLVGTQMNNPQGLAVDAAGNIYAADSRDNAIVKFTPGNSTPVLVASASTLGPTAIALDASGNIYAVNSGYSIYKIPAGSGTITTFFTEQTNYLRPEGIAVDAAGNIYFTDGDSSNPVKKFPADGSGIVGLGAGLSYCKMLAAMPSGSVFTNGQVGALYKITPGYYSVSASLPAGLFLNANSGIISGIPTVASPATNYMVTAHNNAGNGSATVNIKVLSSNTFLSNLVPSKGGLNVAFGLSPDGKYTSNVSNVVTSITVTPTAQDSTATIKINGAVVNSGSASAPIPLAVGQNVITTVVTAQDGTHTQTYTLTVTRFPSSNNYLSTLLLSRGILSPAFNHLTNSYTAPVSNAITSITVTPTATDTASTLTVNGTAVASGTTSAAIPLAIGSNSITIEVTAQNGNTNTYVVNITRAPSPDTFLSTLAISHGILSPKFSHLTTSYTTEVTNAISSVTITPTTANPGATVTVNGSSVPSGTASAAIPLAVGDNAITTVVTAPDGVTTLTYTVSVTRAGASMDAVYEPVSVAKPLENPQLAADNLNVREGISPNGDGINDFLVIENIAGYPDNKLQILNRSGQLIFEAKNYDNSSNVFDGHSSKTGAKQSPGTYFYSLDYTVKGVAKHKTGFIVLKY